MKAFRFDSLSIPRPTTGLMSPRSRPPPMFQAITSNTINRLPTNRSMSFDNSFTQRLGAISKASNGTLSKCPVLVKLRPRGVSELGPLSPNNRREAIVAARPFGAMNGLMQRTNLLDQLVGSAA